MARKRAAEAPPAVPPLRKDKKQKTSTLPKTPKPHKQAIPLRPDTARNASTGSVFTVVPATPGTIVELPAKDKQTKARAPAPSTEKQQKQQKQQKKPQEPPSTLPLEPHAAILGDLQAKYAVRVLSVISSTRMEKRIKAILDHLASGGGGGGGGGDSSTGKSIGQKASMPGVVLLHARAPDANKLVSITEIVKRRIREGHFEAAPAADPTTDGPPKSTTKSKKKGKSKRAQASSAVAWYQYDRIYDVRSARKKRPNDGNAAKGADGAGSDEEGGEEDEEEDDGFEPAMHRLESALGGAQGSATAVTTYMSIILSRVPLSELHKNPEISVQCSTDPLEVEYEEYMAEA